MILDFLAKELEAQGFSSSFVSSENNQLEKLIINLGFDSKSREQMLTVTSIQLEAGAHYANLDLSHTPYQLQFRFHFPFKVEDLSLNQVASLLHYLNQSIDFPGFELAELEGLVLFRYVWIADPLHLQASIIAPIIGAILLNLALFTDMIESVARGDITFDGLLKKMIESAGLE